MFNQASKVRTVWFMVRIKKLYVNKARFYVNLNPSGLVSAGGAGVENSILFFILVLPLYPPPKAIV